MPLTTSSEQESENLKGDLEPSLKPDMDVAPAAPRKSRKFSKLVLLTASKYSTKMAGAMCKGACCIMSLGVPGPAIVAKALLKTHPEPKQTIEGAPQEPEPKHGKLELGEAGGAHLAPIRDNLVPVRAANTAGSCSKSLLFPLS